MLVKNVDAFCPCPKSLLECKVKIFGLIPSAKEISKQPSVDSVMWLFVVTLMKIYNEKEQTEQSKLQNVRFEEKRSSKKWNGAMFCIQRDEFIKKWKKGVVTSGQNPTVLSFQVVKRN